MSAQALAQDVAGMPAAEREAYLEACLIITQTDPALAGAQRVGTGSVTRGHASVALFDIARGQSMQLDCSFTVPTTLIPTAEQLTVTYGDKTTAELDPVAANAQLQQSMAKP